MLVNNNENTAIFVAASASNLLVQHSAATALTKPALDLPNGVILGQRRKEP